MTCGSSPVGARRDDSRPSVNGFLAVTFTLVSLVFLEVCCRLKADDGELGDSWLIPLCCDIFSSVSGDQSSLWM